MKQFLRRNSDRHSKLGRNRRKKQIWRKPKGRHNKMREKLRGYPAIVKVGYRKSREERGKFDGKGAILIKNINDLNKIKKNEVGIIGKIGKKKKIIMIQKAKEKGIILYNVNMEKFLKRNKFKKKENAPTEVNK